MKDNTLVKDLNQLVATLFHSYVLYKGYHWNFKGKSFYQYHKLLDEHATKIYASIDEVAERVRQLDGVTEGRFPEYSKLSVLEVTETNDVNEDDLEARLKTLLNLHETIIKFLEDTITAADDASDEGTADLLTKFLEEHQMMRWFIKASLNA